MNTENKSTKIFTKAYICSIACIDCGKKTNTNRHLELFSGGMEIENKGEPLVMCKKCMDKLNALRRPK